MLKIALAWSGHANLLTFETCLANRCVFVRGSAFFSAYGGFVPVQ